MDSAQIVATVSDLCQRSLFDTVHVRVRYFIDGKEIGCFIKDSTKGPMILGRIDKDNPNSCGVVLPAGWDNFFSPTGKLMKGGFSRHVLTIDNGILKIPTSNNRVWITSDKCLFNDFTDVSIWNIDTLRDGFICLTLLSDPNSFQNVTKQDVTLQPFDSQMDLSIDRPIYVAICNHELVYPGVVRVEIDHLVPLSADERKKLDQLAQILN